MTTAMVKKPLEQVEDEQFGGLYRAIVLDIRDPLRQSRVKVKVPALNGEGALGWAMPCVMPGNAIVLPARGTAVWVMFEHANIDFPVWMGTWLPTAPVTPVSSDLEVVWNTLMTEAL